MKLKAFRSIFALVAYFLFAGLRYHVWVWGVAVTILGAGLNILVMRLNRWKMPVKTGQMIYELGPRHTVLHAYTRCPWLCDIFDLPSHFGHSLRGFVFRSRAMTSIGDVLIYAGIPLLWLQLVYAFATSK